jgi:hypothetical protein
LQVVAVHTRQGRTVLSQPPRGREERKWGRSPKGRWTRGRRTRRTRRTVEKEKEKEKEKEVGVEVGVEEEEEEEFHKKNKYSRS